MTEERKMTATDEIHADIAARTRRHFLRDSALVGGSVLASGLAGTQAQTATVDNLPPNVPEWMKTPGEPTGSPLYGMPSSFEKDVVKNISKTLPQYLSASSRTPLQDLDGIITPNGLFYERHHGGVPTIDPAQHRLMLHGLVDRSLIFTMDDLRRFPSESRIHFLECSGNPGYKKPFGKTAADLVGLVSCAEWTGVSLKLVLQAMLVYSQNGERLRPQQGYPLRLLLPGFEGNMSVKWLRRLHVTAEPAYSREETSKYTDLMPDGSAREFTFYMETKSIITRPSGSQRLTSQGFHEISGLAWSGRGRIKRVEVSVDDGKSWQDAQLQEPVLRRALTRFRFPWRWDGQPVVIQSRAIDETGYVQPTLAELLAVRGDNSVYHNNATWPWRIAADGEVSNALA
jgi:sulfane dehydrogenase subunit SoxC